jgi:hypothetical protein
MYFGSIWAVITVSGLQLVKEHTNAKLGGLGYVKENDPWARLGKTQKLLSLCTSLYYAMKKYEDTQNFIDCCDVTELCGCSSGNVQLTN